MINIVTEMMQVRPLQRCVEPARLRLHARPTVCLRRRALSPGVELLTLAVWMQMVNYKEEQTVSNVSVTKSSMLVGAIMGQALSRHTHFPCGLVANVVPALLQCTHPWRVWPPMMTRPLANRLYLEFWGIR